MVLSVSGPVLNFDIHKNHILVQCRTQSDNADKSNFSSCQDHFGSFEINTELVDPDRCHICLELTYN
jgi:hypothetical protein